MKEKIIEKLEALEPTVIQIQDVSHLHKGHSGWREGGETHFELVISSEKFNNLTKVKSHQLIYKVLEEEMKQIHALQIELKY